jgi:hypothetical protein
MLDSGTGEIHLKPMIFNKQLSRAQVNTGGLVNLTLVFGTYIQNPVCKTKMPATFKKHKLSLKPPLKTSF